MDSHRVRCPSLNKSHNDWWSSPCPLYKTNTSLSEALLNPHRLRIGERLFPKEKLRWIIRRKGMDVGKAKIDFLRSSSSRITGSPDTWIHPVPWDSRSMRKHYTHFQFAQVILQSLQIHSYLFQWILIDQNFSNHFITLPCWHNI